MKGNMTPCQHDNLPADQLAGLTACQLAILTFPFKTKYYISVIWGLSKTRVEKKQQ